MFIFTGSYKEEAKIVMKIPNQEMATKKTILIPLRILIPRIRVTCLFPSQYIGSSDWLFTRLSDSSDKALSVICRFSGISSSGL